MVENSLIYGIILDVLGKPKKTNVSKQQYSFDCPVCSAEKGEYEGDGKGNFASVPTKESGLFLDGEIRDMTTVDVAGKKYLLATRNNNSMLTFKVK